MRPELIENPTFLRYYEKWQRDPTSIVFAAISEIFKKHNMIDDAIKIAIEGLKHHPSLVSGRLALAKAYLAKGEERLAKEQAALVLTIMPSNEEAKQLVNPQSAGTTAFENVEEITEDMPMSDVEDDEETDLISDNAAWHTMTMAQILESQGHFERARKIYRSILEKDPHNQAARQKLGSND